MAARSKSIEQLRDGRLLLVAEVDDRRHAAQDASDLPRQRRAAREVGAEDLHGQVRLAARDHVVDAVADRLAEADADAGDRCDRAAASPRAAPPSGRPRPSTTSISEAFTPCTCSSFSARPVRRLVETTSGNAEQRLLDLAAERVALCERRPGRAHQADGEAALVEGRQEGAAEERHDRPAAPTSASAAAAEHERAVRERSTRSTRRVARLEPRRSHGSSLLEQPAARQQQQAQHGRHA